MSLTPKVWGPSTWIMLHLLTLSYPDKPTLDDMENHKKFLLSLSDVLPCNECRDHFKGHLRKCTLSHALKSKKDYVKCVWQMHNDVSPDKAIDFDEFIKIYDEILKMDGFNPIKINNELRIYKYLSVGLLILLVIDIFITLYHNKKS
jgi:hypothetical protein